MPQVQALFAVDPVHPLPVHAPALASKQDMNAEIPVPYPRLRYLPDTHPQNTVASTV